MSNETAGTILAALIFTTFVATILVAIWVGDWRIAATAAVAWLALVVFADLTKPRSRT